MKHFSQHDQIDCGPTCLRMIANFYGRYYSSQYIRRLSEVTRQGASLYGIGVAAEKIGFKVMTAELSYKYLTEKGSLPCILYWDRNHFCVLYKIAKHRSGNEQKTKFYIADPSAGKFVLDNAKFKEFWLSGLPKGFALFLEPTNLFYENQNTDDEIFRPKTFSYLLTYLGKYRKNYLQVIFAMLLAAAISVLLPMLTKAIVDVGVQQKDVGFITVILAFQLSLFVANTFSEFIRSQLLLHIGVRINSSILSDFLIKLMKLPLSFFESKMGGDIIQRINDHKRIEKFVTSTLLATLFAGVNFLVFAIILYSYNTAVILIFLVGSLSSLCWSLLFMKHRKTLEYVRFRELAGVNDKLYEFVHSIAEIKLNTFEQYKQWEWQDIQVRLFKMELSNLKLEQYQKMGSDFFEQVKNIVLTFVCAYAVIQGQMTLGTMLAISYIVGQMNYPLRQFIEFINNFQTAKIALERMSEVNNLEDEENAHLIGYTHRQFGVESGIMLNDVSFTYNGANMPALNRITLQIPHQRVTAIVGASGSGKTTLMKVLLKLYQPSDGTITCNGENIQTISSKEWRMKCGVVMQDGYIFSDTIKRNIVMSDESEDNERLMQAVEIANIGDYIYDLPLHFETKLGATSGIGMSGGQKQRILIARAVYKNPDFIFFDEATSALDSTNERKIMDALEIFFNKRTVVVIAHRLSTVKNADQIVVMDKGEIVEVGSHRELIRKEGTYFNLIRNQLELNT